MDYPTGIVTFLFTDIEGSSSLWESHPAGMSDAVKSHDALTRRTVESHRGIVVKATGDGAFSVFADPLHAVTAAFELQRGLSAPESSNAAPLRVRCGIHTGEANHRDSDYFGEEVNRAGRIMSAGHGGQILVSSSAAELVRDRLASAFSLRDLGEVHLRDLAHSTHIYQLEHPDLRADFPPLRHVATFTSNLPVQRAPLIGRAEDLEALNTLIASHRLVAIVGAGGIGKTRLAQAAAREQVERFEHGVWWVDLTSYADATQIIGAISAILGVRSEATQDARGRLLSTLKVRRALFVLDNCEHVFDVVASLVESALAVAPGVRWVITSQQPLKLDEEQIYRLGTLAVPAPGTAASEAVNYGAIALLARCVQFADRRFAIGDANVGAAIDLCAHLDGIALAIEMAAARIPALGLDKVVTLLGERFRFLTAGTRLPLARHQTLHAALDWSHSLLSADEQVTFRRLGRFEGGFTTELAQQVAADGAPYASGSSLDEWRILDALTSLVAKSMVQVRSVPGPNGSRFALLETTRLYALERLDIAGEREAASARHARVMAEFAEQAFNDHWTRADAPWLAHVEPETDNLGAALRWSIEHEDAEIAAAIVGSSWPLFRLIDRQNMAQSWMASAESLLRRASPPRVARALTAIPYIFSARGGNRSILGAREAVQQNRQVGDASGLYLALTGLAYAGTVFADRRSDADREATAALEELERMERRDWPPARMRCWSLIVRSIRLGHDHAARADLLRGMIELASSAGATERALTAQIHLIDSLHDLGRIDETIALSRTLVQSGLVRGERLGELLAYLAEALARQGNHNDSRQFAREGLRVLSLSNMEFEAFARFVSMAAIEHRYSDAAKLAGYAETLFAANDVDREAHAARSLRDQLTQLDAHLGTSERERLMHEGGRMTPVRAASVAFDLPERPLIQ